MTTMTINVHVKHTDDVISVPVTLQSTMKDIIEYVTAKNTLDEKGTSDDYYVVFSNNDQLLKDETTVEETHAFSIENARFELCEKSKLGEQLLLLANRNSIADKVEPISNSEISADFVRPIETTNDSRKSLIPESPYLNPIDLQISLPVEGSSVASMLTNKSISESSDQQQNSLFSKDYPISLTNTAASIDNTSNTDRKSETSVAIEPNVYYSSSPIYPSLGSVQRQESLRKGQSLSMNADPTKRLENALANAYVKVTATVENIVGAATRDPVARQSILTKFNEINIVLCGSPRVGKSSLINAICQQTLAKTSPGLDSCTRGISHYALKGSSENESEVISYQYNFWDTPGFENWTRDEIRKNLERIFSKPKSDILCVIYCASPGSYANLQQVRWLLDECMSRQIFCALVCTNKWCGSKKQREALMKDFQSLLESYNPKTREANGVIYYGKKALCTSVNSDRFVDEDIDKAFEPSGVDELIVGIMEALDEEKLLQWCKVVLENKPFWKRLFNFPTQLESLWGRLLNMN